MQDWLCWVQSAGRHMLWFAGASSGAFPCVLPRYLGVGGEGLRLSQGFNSCMSTYVVADDTVGPEISHDITPLHL